MERSKIWESSLVTRYSSEKNSKVMKSVNKKNGMDMSKEAKI